MKTIGLLGGTGWSSTIPYYQKLNEKIAARLGGFHSAKILLNSIDYHTIMTHYGIDHDVVARELKHELEGLFNLNPDCILICCNSLHKYYDIIQSELSSALPIMHAVELTADELQSKKYKKVLLLATKFTMDDGFFEKTIASRGIDVVLPTETQRLEMQAIHDILMQNVVTDEARTYFGELTRQHPDCDAVILGCTEYGLVLDQHNSHLPVVDPVELQTDAAVRFALE